eukprot:6213009-Pleurochrysis_carterae.AAC.7
MLLRRTRACACGTPANVPEAYTFVRRNEQRACICKQATYTSMSISTLQPWAPHKQMHVYQCEWHCPHMVYLDSNKSNICSNYYRKGANLLRLDGLLSDGRCEVVGLNRLAAWDTAGKVIEHKFKPRA